MPKVLIADSLSPQAVAVFKERGIETVVKPGLTPQELKDTIADFDGLAVRSATRVTKPVIEAAAKLKVIGRAGIGVDTIDVPAATQRGIVVMNTPFGNSITTAEHAIAMMFALARDIPAANASTQAGKWEKTRFMGVELYGKTLGIIGCGNIGSIVADRALGIKMKVIAYDPFLSAERAVTLGVEKVDLDDLFARSDFITLHTPLTDQTRNIVNAATIAKMKKGVRIINCARGGLVVEEDLKVALDSGKIAGAALDVFPVEPAKENILFGRDNIVATPHLGASTSEAQENVAVQIAEQMSDFLLDGAVTNAVNVPSISAEEAVRLGPYMTLAKQLGGFVGQLIEGPINAVEIEYEGHVADLNVKPLTAIVLAGLLAPTLATVNVVNVAVICRERDIRVSETRRSEPSNYQTLMRVTSVTGGTRHSVTGTLFGAKPRVIEVEGIMLEAELGPRVLLVRNIDKPGFVGNLGRTLGDAGINIGTFNMGRIDAGGNAICLITVDSAMNSGLLECVHAIPNVVQAKLMSF
jgi:D-3-phosphoglycerate dehydrogenase / 2-oxoglutarate reductase